MRLLDHVALADHARAKLREHEETVRRRVAAADRLMDAAAARAPNSCHHGGLRQWSMPPRA